MLVATDKASRRTKNRLKEHENLELVRTAVLDTGWHHLLSCTDCEWLGWLPVDEVTEE